MLKINILGTGHGMATKCYNTCFTIEEDNKHFLVDTGGGNEILKQLELSNIDIENISDIFISHSHLDHILGVIWIIRNLSPKYFHNKKIDDIRIYGNQDVIYVLNELVKLFISRDFLYLINNKIKLIEVSNEEEVTILNRKVTFFDLNAIKKIQYGFNMQIDDKIKFSFIGDECCSTSTEKYIKGAEWLFADAYMCGKKAEIYNSVDKHHHSSVKYISEIAEKNMIKNLILSHTNDDNIKNRRKEFTEDAINFFSGKVFIPNDLDVIIIK